MPLEMEIERADLRRLQLALQRLGQEEMYQTILGSFGETIKQKTKVYPPAVPRRTVGWWYERGWGWQKDGVRQAETSERLRNQWYTKVFPSYVEVGNKASYAGWVHGDVQRYIHERQGWRKLYDVAIDELPGLITKAKAQVRKIWEAKI